MKNKYKKLLAGVLATQVLLTTGCSCKKDTRIPSSYDPNTGVYTIGTGDTLTGISKYYYGTREYYDEIAEFNGIKNPDEIRAGDKIYLPSIPSLCSYVIQERDTLTQICKSKYGKGDIETATKLAYYNGISNPDNIWVGQVIVVPEYETLKNFVYVAPTPQIPTSYVSLYRK